MHHTGSCLCGDIKFEVSGELPGPDGCHCTQCRKFSGHYFASTDVPKSSLKMLSGSEKITWFHTETVRRGFCSKCGSSLFWDPLEKDWIGIAMGSFDSETKTKMRIHIFVGNKGDYYEISDGLPQNSQ